MRIDPFAALDPGDDRYVARPRGGGAWLAKRIQRGLAPLLLVGHPGLGKSTELRRAAGALRETGVAVLLDLAALKHGEDPARVLYDIAVQTVQWWVEEGPEDQPSPFLVQDLRASDPHFPQGQGRSLSPREIALAAFGELTAAARTERVPLLIDGVDRLDAQAGRGVVRALLELEAHAELVVVASPSLATGPDNVDVLDRMRVVVLDPLDPMEAPELEFLQSVARAHLALDAGADEALTTLARASGGVLRDLLGLARDSWAYADDEVDEASIAEAVRDRTERFRRLLLAGDREALRAADSTSGLEVPAERKTRLMQHGLLLECGVAGEARVRLHPLLAALLDVD